MGKDLDYFRVTFLKNIKRVGGKTVNIGDALQERFLEVYGEKPTSLNIKFADDEVSSVWDAYYEGYKQGGFYFQAGSTADSGLWWQFYRDPDTAEVLISGGRPRNDRGIALMRQPIDLTKPVYVSKKGTPVFLEPVGRLNVVIEELASVAVGYFEFRPESPRDIRNISAELGRYADVAKAYGKTIAGIPFRLVRREEEVPKRIDEKLTRGMSWVVHLDVTGEWGKRALSALESLALPEIVEGETVPLLTAPEQEEEMPVMSYEDAAQTIITMRGGNEKFLSELNIDQLNKLVAKDTPFAEAARIVLKHDFNLDPPPTD